MANKALFGSVRQKQATPKLVVNEAGGRAYELPAKHKLAQYACTGTLNGTYYTSAEGQLAVVLDTAGKVEPQFVAKCAVYARERGFMKDLPALLLGVLASTPEGSKYLPLVFSRVVDGGKMVCNFAQMIRSGQCGRKSFGSMPKRLIQNWLDERTDEQVFRASVGTSDPSLSDVIRMVHPRPKTDSRKALYGFLSDRNKPEHAIKYTDLPALVRAYLEFKAHPAEVTNVPDVPFLLLTALPLTDAHWKGIARTMSWQATRMNLNTLLRHKVFEDRELVKLVADRLRNREAILKARVFPYQLLAAYKNVDEGLPRPLVDALHDAMEVSVENVPVVDGKVYVFPDVSGSMRSAVTGNRPGATSKVECLDVAALVAASMLRRNPGAEVLAFSDYVVPCRLEPRDTVMTNAARLAGLPSGGTNCSAPLAELNRRNAKGDLVVYVSDNESWVDSNRASYGGRGTATIQEWNKFLGRNPKAKMVCIDIQPYGTVQANDRPNVLNVGGFSDDVFNVMASFVKGEMGKDHWTGVIEEVAL
jgi:60 kDa SS-A/Ro ribonucleoprotein